MIGGNPHEGEQPYTNLRCPCGTGLWRRYADHIEMTISPRGGKKRKISKPVTHTGGLEVTCETCGRIWTAGPDVLPHD